MRLNEGQRLVNFTAVAHEEPEEEPEEIEGVEVEEGAEGGENTAAEPVTEPTEA